jgi:CRP-like cAMP-binding protein
MAISPPARTPAENRLLAALPRETYERLLSKLEPVRLPFKEVLIEPNRSIEHVYFVSSGVTSLLIPTNAHTAVEVATVGNEGMIGLPIFLGAGTTDVQAIVQIPGDGTRMKADQFKEEVDRDAALVRLLHRYTHALLTQFARAAVCGRAHSIEARCARWLLQTHDRMRTDEFHLKQEFLAQMLGVGRPRVSSTASVLQKTGLIRYSRGRITILDREGLENASCECYGVIRRAYNHLQVQD